MSPATSRSCRFTDEPGKETWKKLLLFAALDLMTHLPWQDCSLN
jgi:hypothetical protein